MVDRYQLPGHAMLRAFDAYGKANGIRGAAKLLDVDHAVVSRHLSALEDFVGVELINRELRKLTPDGEEYHRSITEALEQIANATLRLRKRDANAALIWCSPGIAFHWLNPRLAKLESLPDMLDLELRPSDRPPNFRANEADGDIRYVRIDSEERLGEGLRSLEVAKPVIFPVASPQFAAEFGGQIKTVEDLLTLRLLHEENDIEWRMWLTRQDVTGLPANLPGERLWHAHLVLDAARSGRGVGLSSMFLAEGLLKTGELVKLELADKEFDPVVLGAYQFVARKDRWSGRGLARFRNWFIKSAREFAAS